MGRSRSNRRDRLVVDRRLGVDRLVLAGFDSVYGARPLKRAIQQELENPLAQRILAGEFPPGSVISADIEDSVTRFAVLPG